jgi:hypothetical protein
MPEHELETRCLRIKQIADEIVRWPAPELVRKLCHEAEAGCGIDPDCAIWFFAVRNAGWDLLSEGGWRASQDLPVAIQILEDVVAAKRLRATAARDGSRTTSRGA